MPGCVAVAQKVLSLPERTRTNMSFLSKRTEIPPQIYDTALPDPRMKLWSLGCPGKENDGNTVNEQKVLTFFDLFAIGLGSSLAIGVTVVIGDLIKNVAGPAVVASIFLAGVTALVGGLCFSEFGVRFVKVNSAYAYSYFWGKEDIAFIFGWILILEYVAGTASAARGIITFLDALADYQISEFLNNVLCINFNNSIPYFDFFSLGIVVLLTVCSVFGLKDYVIIKKIFTSCNAVLVVCVITAGAFKADPNNWHTEPNTEEGSSDRFAPFGVLGIIKGAAIAFYGFIGFDRVSVSGQEVHNHKTNVPAAILLTVTATLLAFGGVGAVLSLILPYEKINPDAAVPFAFQEIGWPAAKWAVAAAAFFGFQTSLFGSMFPLPRIIHAMANDGLLFPFLGNSYHQIPVVATVTGGLLASAAAGIFTLQKLVNLTIIAALFAFTILAINVILFRYSSKSENDEALSGSWKNLINKNSDVTVTTVVKNYFNFKEKHPTNITEKIVMTNVILFCISSIGLGVILNFFYNSLSGCAPEAVVPASILLSIMCFNLISMICQPKSRETIPFKVPLIPILPCLSIFLNIFLIITFESLTWILFLSWMAVGVLPHAAWRLVKYFRGEVGKNSLYEINRTNTIKLNESIWKIKLEKKSFYEGAVNPVFSDDLEERFSEIKGGVMQEIPVQNRNDKSILQVKNAAIIQTADLVLEEGVDPLNNESDVDFIGVRTAEVVNDTQEEDDRVQWECVAEIHTEEEFQKESVALEIVDNTYNFISDVSEELKNDSRLPRVLAESEKESLNGSDKFLNSSDGSNSPPSQIIDNYRISEEKLSDDEVKTYKIGNSDSESHNEYSSNVENSQPISKTNEVSFVVDFSRKSSETNSDSPFSQENQKKLYLVNGTDETILETSSNKTISPAIKSTLDEHNKVKEFKERLNQLLKNHVNDGTTSPKTSFQLKTTKTDEVDSNNNGNDKKALFNNIKTLNKSQIKGKLEFLLSKGPPKRASLRDSFNIKLKETDEEKDSGEAGDQTVIIQNENVSESKKNIVSSSTLQDSIKEKLLALKNMRGEMPKDIYC